MTRVVEQERHGAPQARMPRSLRDVFPRGEGLSEERWSARHRGITAILWAHALGLPLIGLVRAQPTLDVLLSGASLSLLAWGAMIGRLGRPARSGIATLGLLSASAVLVDVFDGSTEAHFHFFVMVAIVALYQAWPPYLIAVAYVVLHHAVLGALVPDQVYSHHGAGQPPWMTALVHGGFILAQSVACLVLWRASEDALDRERAARSQADSAHDDLVQAQQVAGMGSWDWDVVTDELTWSAQTYAITGLSPETFTPTIAGYFRLVHPDDEPRFSKQFTCALESSSGLDAEVRLVRPDGDVRHVHVLGEWTTGADGTLSRFLGVIHDVTERRRLQAEIEHMAFHDALTGLANRTLFLDRLGEALAVAERTGGTCAVLFIDLDEFKTINDTYGHQAGDEALREAGERLVAAARSSDTIARFGGDEFAVLCDDVDAATANRVAERIRAELHRPVRLSDAEVVLGGSIGIATSCGGASAQDVLRAADAAMYAQKAGR